MRRWKNSISAGMEESRMAKTNSPLKDTVEVLRAQLKLRVQAAEESLKGLLTAAVNLEKIQSQAQAMLGALRPEGQKKPRLRLKPGPLPSEQSSSSSKDAPAPPAAPRVTNVVRVLAAAKDWKPVEKIAEDVSLLKRAVYSTLMGLKKAGRIEVRGEHGQKEYRAK